MRDYRKLHVWQKAHKPGHSVGSCNELEYDLLLARDLGFLPTASHSRLTGHVEEVRRMLTGLVQRITTG